MQIKIFSRDRFKLLASKLYMNEPDKRQSQNKLHYVEELFSCFKQGWIRTFFFDFSIQIQIH